MRLLLTLFTLAFPISGDAVYSAKGVAERVVQYRLTEMKQDLRCSYCVGYAALADKSMLGRDIWIRRDGEVLAEGPFRVSDASKAEHRDTFVGLGRVVEVDWNTAVRWGMAGVGPMRVTVYNQAPPPPHERSQPFRAGTALRF
jgi:hypothetical protein